MKHKVLTKFLCIVIFILKLSKCTGEKLYNCTGEAIISDQFDEYAIPLKISQNRTDISSENIYKGSEVIVTGDADIGVCCN